MNEDVALEFKTIIFYELKKGGKSKTDYKIKVSETLKVTERTVERYLSGTCGFTSKNSSEKYYKFLKHSAKYLGVSIRELLKKQKLYHELDLNIKEELSQEEKKSDNTKLYDKWIYNPFELNEKLEEDNKLIKVFKLLEKAIAVGTIEEGMDYISKELTEISEEFYYQNVKGIWSKLDRKYKEKISVLYSYYKDLNVCKEFLMRILFLPREQKVKRDINKILENAVNSSRKRFVDIMGHGLSKEIINLVCMQECFIKLNNVKKGFSCENGVYKYKDILDIDKPGIELDIVLSCMKLVGIFDCSEKGSEPHIKKDCLNKAIAFAMLSKNQRNKVMDEITKYMDKYNDSLYNK